MQDLKKLGKIGLIAILYFELVTTLALLIGLGVGNFFKPGHGMNINAAELDSSAVEKLQQSKKTITEILIPKDPISPFIDGEILQILILAIITGIILSLFRPKAQKVISGIDYVMQLLFKVLKYIMYLAPIAAFGAMAYTVGKFGGSSLIGLGKLMLSVYLTCILFIFVVLGFISFLFRIHLIRFLSYIKEEILLVLGTSSSESALPSMMKKLEEAGCSKSAAGLIIPAGYSFNLDGTSIYLTMAALFLAQATNTQLTFDHQLLLIGMLMLTSKGAAAVSGGGLITLAATLSSVEMIPVASIALIIGVDRFMSEARAITNLIGNGIATLIISRWDKEYDKEKGKFLRI